MRPSVRFEVFKRDQFTCSYCGRKSPDVILEVDHVLARSKGGTDAMDNLVTSCEECNRGKAARPLGQRAPMLDPTERARRLKEHEQQIAMYAHWRAAQRDREALELQSLGDRFGQIPGAIFKRGDDERWCWQEASARNFIRRLGYHGVLDAIEATDAASYRWSGNDPDRRAYQVWRYFCGCCWRSIKGPNDE